MKTRLFYSLFGALMGLCTSMADASPSINFIVPQSDFTPKSKITILGTDFGNDSTKINVNFHDLLDSNNVFHAAKTTIVDKNKIVIELPDESGTFDVVVIVGNTESDKYRLVIKNNEKVSAASMLIYRPLTITTEGYYSNKVENVNELGKLNNTKTSQGIFNLCLEYKLPLSSIYYVSNNKPSATPPYLTDKIVLYLQGTYGNTVNLQSSSVSYKSDKTASYKVGIKFSATFDEILQNKSPNDFKY